MPRIGKPGAKGKGLGGKRILGLPAPVVIGGLVLAVAGGLYLRHKSSPSAAQNPTAAAPASGLDSTGGAGSSAAGQNDYAQPFEDLAFALNGLTGVLGSGAGFQTTTDPGQTSTQQATAPTYVYSPTYSASGSPSPSVATSTAVVPDYTPYTAPTLKAIATPLPTNVQQTAVSQDYNPSGVNLPDTSPQQVPAPAPANVTPAYYGVTSGPVAGARASSTPKQGVISIH